MNCHESLLDAHRKGYRVTSGGDVISRKGKVRKPTLNRAGYFRFRHANGGSPISVHRLQAYQKFGDAMFAPGIEVRHLDGNPKNNSAENIAIGTKSDNAMDRPAEVRRRMAINASRHSMKYSHAEVKAYLNEGHSYRQAMQRFGITSKGTVSYIAKKSLYSTPTPTHA